MNMGRKISDAFRLTAFILNGIMENNFLLFASGVCMGAGFELLKNNLVINGISFYKVFNKNNARRELEAFENKLKEREHKITELIELLKADITQQQNK